LIKFKFDLIIYEVKNRSAILIYKKSNLKIKVSNKKVNFYILRGNIFYKKLNKYFGELIKAESVFNRQTLGT